MNPSTQTLVLQGATGPLEARLDAAPGPSRGLAVLCHPHPLFGGTMDNKVVQTMARAFVQSGWDTLRFNFRGVGGSGGSFDNGLGESDDLRMLIDQCLQGRPLALAGFSFGAFVVCQTLASIFHAQALDRLVLVGTATGRFAVPPLPAELHPRSLVVHGEIDDTVPLASVMDWARPQTLPITVVPGGGHFFHGQLPLLKSLVLRHLA